MSCLFINSKLFSTWKYSSDLILQWMSCNTETFPKNTGIEMVIWKRFSMNVCTIFQVRFPCYRLHLALTMPQLWLSGQANDLRTSSTHIDEDIRGKLCRLYISEIDGNECLHLASTTYATRVGGQNRVWLNVMSPEKYQPQQPKEGYDWPKEKLMFYQFCFYSQDTHIFKLWEDE